LATTTTTAGTTVNAILQSGNNIISYVVPIPYTTTWPTALLKNGQLITDAQGNIPPNTTITTTGTSGNNTITLSAPATGSTTITAVQTFTGTVVVSYETISSITPASVLSSLSLGQPILGPNIPNGTVITGLPGVSGGVTTPAGSITISQFPTASLGAEIVGASLSVLATTILTTTTLQTIRVDTAVASQSVTITQVETVSPSLGTATLSQPVTGFTGTNTLIVEGTDNMDVEPYDAGAATPAISPSGGPVPIPGTSPSVYGGFFDTASSFTSSATNPAGSTFARTFSQVLAVLYGSTVAQTYEGGFFPNGVSGNINNV
jgi:hypothetical protein